MTHGKKYRAAAEKVNPQEQYTLDKAVELVKAMGYAKFDETVEVAMKLSIKSKHTIRDVMALPHRFGKEKTILVFAKGDKAEEARKAGATHVGDDDLIEKIKGGWLDFDVAVATPDMMKDVGKLGKILGPRGLMPNPKSGTVTFDLAKAVSDARAGKIEYRTDKTGNVHVVFGKASFTAEQLKGNLLELAREIVRAKPAAAKGQYIRSATISTTMGPGIRLDVTALVDSLKQ